MDIGLSIPIKMSAQEKEQYTKNAKEIGVTSIWVGDNPPINNAFLDIGRLFSNVQDMKFWTGITSPFYYSIEVLFSLSVWFSRNYPTRFGLGLGIGNMGIIEDETIRKKPFTSFRKELERLLEIARVRKIKQKEDDFPPLAVGGLGKKMFNLAFEKADCLLLNSGSNFDLERAMIGLEESLLSGPKGTYIIPYSMIQIIEDKAEMSLTHWNIAKDIAKSCSTKILQSHNYSSEMIGRIRDLPWERQKIVPTGDIQKIAHDFAIYGTKEEVFERLSFFKEHGKEENIKGIVLGWIYSEEKWDDIKEIVKFLK